MSKTKSSLFSVRVVCQLALLVALEIVFNRLLSINTEALKIGFSFVPIVLCAVLFGPVHAAIVYAVADTLGALMFPLGAYMPGITLSCALMGLDFGLFLHGFVAASEKFELSKFKTWLRIVCPIVINCVAFGLLANSFWLSLVYTKRSFAYFFTSRIIEYSVLIPVQIILVPIIITLARRLRASRIA
ncbi:MAG: folate family ECF transporter S component [Oscillospiraceae bacterium]|jgi:ECF transporter S component (folate family)|nr:folate family ECF transporter S component [Oscillospiraceae bacterium]